MRTLIAPGVLTAALILLQTATAAAQQAVFRVPEDHATIQAAVDAAAP